MENLTHRLRLMLITDSGASPRPLVEAVELALPGGVTSVMLREKTMSSRELYDLTIALRRLTREASALLIVNDRVDIALAADADGVHLGWQSMPIDAARRLIGPDRLIGVSTHSITQARDAVDQGADYVTFSPIFATPSKEGLVEPQGTHAITLLRREIAIPIIALGGIDSSNASGVRSAGADGIAVIRAILNAPDPKEAARMLR